MNRRGLLVSWAVAGALALPVHAAGTPDVKIQAVLGGVLAHDADGVAAETLWLKGDRVRVDFDAGQGRRGRILRDGHTGCVRLQRDGVSHAVAVDSTTASAYTSAPMTAAAVATLIGFSPENRGASNSVLSVAAIVPIMRPPTFVANALPVPRRCKGNTFGRYSLT